MQTELHTHLEGDKPVSCDGCAWTGVAEQLRPIDRLAERIHPGEVVPAGECPKCGALAHLQGLARPELLEVLENMAYHIQNMLDAYTEAQNPAADIQGILFDDALSNDMERVNAALVMLRGGVG